jgi:hypothetical protein
MTATKLQSRFAVLKRLLPRAVWQPLRSLGTGVITPVRFSLRTGHWKSSMAMSARAANGRPVPWYTYPAIDFLAQRDFQDRNVLEIGVANQPFGGRPALALCSPLRRTKSGAFV